MSIRITPVALSLCILSSLSFSQTLSQGQVDMGAAEVRTNPAMKQKALEALKADPSLIDRVPADRRGEVMDAMGKEAQGAERFDSPAETFQDFDAPELDSEYKGEKGSEEENGSRQEKRRSDIDYRFTIEGYLDRSIPLPKSRIYGRQVFTDFNQDIRAVEPPDDYVVVPGDEVLLRFWGGYRLDKRTRVGSDGYIYVDPIRKQQYVVGMTYGNLKAMVRDIVKSRVDVEGEARIITKRTIKINIAGEARHPGTIAIPPFYTFWQALMTSGGPSSLGSVRDISLVRKGEVVHTLDIYSFLETGTWPHASLRDNDIIFFHKVGKIAAIGDIVNRPGIYELRSDENIMELVEVAGGLRTSELSTVLHVDRLISLSRQKQNSPTRTTVDVDLASEDWGSFQVKDMDLIYPKPKVAAYENDVTIQGSGVYVPGRYAINGSLATVSDAIQKAGGFTPGYYPKAEVVRLTETGTRSIQIDLTEKDKLSTFQLMAGDIIKTYHQTQFRSMTTVKSSGFFRDTVVVPYSDKITLLSLVQRSSGTNEGALDYVLVKKTDPYGAVSYKQYSIADTVLMKSVLLDPRDEVIAFNFRDFNRTLPVVALAYGSEPITVPYSDDLNLEIIIHQLKGLHPLIDSQFVEILTPDFTDNVTLSTSNHTKLDPSTSRNTSLINPGAVVFFRKDSRKSTPEYITVEGEVTSPGRYGLVKQTDRLSWVIERSGGLTPRANPYSIRVIRDGYPEPIPVMVKKADPLIFENDWILNQGDKVVIKRDDYAVRVEGAVFDPREVAYDPDFSWKDYIRKGAGGALDTADLKRTYIKYPNGATFRADRGWFTTTRVVSGSVVVVPMKPYKEPEKKEKIDADDIVKMMGILSTAATTLLTVVLISEKL